MMKFIKSVLMFASFSIVLYVVLIVYWGNNKPIYQNLNYNIGTVGHAFTRFKELRTTKNIDILFLGSSHTFRGFDTRIFNETGFKTFNMGTNSQTPIQTEFLLNRYLDSLNPHTIVFEVCPLVFSLDGVESLCEIISNDDINFETIKLALNQNHLMVYNTLIYALFREIVYDDINNFYESRKRHDDTYINGGFVDTKLMFYTQESFDEQKWVYNKAQFKSFKKIINLIKVRNIKLILVQSPITSDLYDAYTNNIAFDKEMRKYGDYYNFNELINLNDTIHFQDYHHLNKYGVKIFNKSILEILNKKIKDRSPL